MAIDLVATLRLNDQLTSALKGVAGAATIGFAAITAAATVSVNKFVEFDTAVRRAGAVAGASASELDLLRQASLELGASTSKSATEVAEASGELASAGFNATQILSALPGVIAASEASGESLALAAQTVGSALSIWALDSAEAARVSDVLAEAANATSADINDLGFAFKYAGAPAAALGITLEETTAAIGLITNAGIDGSSAGTALRAALLALNNPAKAQAKIMEQVGFSVKDASGDFKSLSGIIGSLGESLEGLAPDEQVGILAKLVGTEAVSGVLALVNAGSEGIDELTESLRNSGGASEETAKQILGGIGGALEELSGTFETLQINVGEALGDSIVEFSRFLAGVDFQPIVNGAVTLGETMLSVAKIIIENWDGIINTVIGVTKAIVAFTVALVAFKVAVSITAAVQTFITLLAAYRAGTLLATAAQLGFNTALLANPIGLITLAIAGLIGVITLLALNWDEVKASTESFWESIGRGQGAIAIVLGPLGFLINAATDLATNWDSTRSVWENVWSAIKSSAETSVNAVIGLINTLIDQINKIPLINIGNIAPVGFKGASASTQINARPSLGETPPAIGGALSTLGNRSNYGLGTPDGSHANGLSNVPYDGYVASLHKGEEVLTRAEADARREQRSSNGGVSGAITIAKLADQIIIREDADINRIADALVTKLNENRGGVTA